MNELTIIYKINKNDNKIKIFNDDFVKNNKGNCKIIINNNKEIELCSELILNENMKKKEIIEIKLKEYKFITNMFAMFAECSSLISLPDICNFDMSKVTNIKRIFYKCSSLTYLPDISKWNTQNINNMRSIFNGCTSLTSLPDISK